MPPLSWQGWVERPLKAWGSSSDLTTVSPSTKLVGVCLDKWTWQPPTMRSPCRLTTPQAYHLAQPRVYVCRDFSISIRLLQVFSCLRMSPLSRQERALSSDDSAVSDAKARRGRAFYRFLLTNPKTKRSSAVCFNASLRAIKRAWRKTPSSWSGQILRGAPECEGIQSACAFCVSALFSAHLRQLFYFHAV